MENKRGRDLFDKFSGVLFLISKLLRIFPDKLIKWLLLLFQQTKGYKGLAIRYVLLKALCPESGVNISIHPNVVIKHPERLVLGKNISIHPFCYIDAVGKIEIGNDVSIAHGTSILSSTHKYNDEFRPIKDQGLIKKKTVIENNVWIGAKATILYGVSIGSGSIIAAHSLVNNDVEANDIVAGSPAKPIKKRI